MSSDIRSFFGGKPSQSSQENTPAKKKEVKKTRGRKVIDDDEDDEDVPVKKTTLKKQSKPAPSKGVETTTSDYFGTSSKPKRSEPVKTKPAKVETPAKANRNATAKTPTNGTPLSSRSRKQIQPIDLDDLDNDDDIFAADFSKGGKVRGDDYEDGTDDDDDDDDEPILPKAGKGRQAKPKKEEDDFVPDDKDVDMNDGADDDFEVPDDDDDVPLTKSKGKKAATTKKRKSNDLDDEDEATPKKGKGKRKASAKSTPAKKKAKKEEVQDSVEITTILNGIPTVRPPTPPPKEENGTYKFDFRTAGNNANAQPIAAGTKEKPVGAENCLAGLSFVFTGVLDTLSRDAGSTLVKQYGGKVMSSGPSKNTSYVVLGKDAGPRKLQIIRENNIKTINEDGLYELIRQLPANGGDSKAAAKYEEKKQKEEDKIRKAAEMIDEEEKKAEQVRKNKNIAALNEQRLREAKEEEMALGPPEVEDRLWTVKYAPTQIPQICGNKKQVERLQTWLRAFPRNKRKDFKMPGADGSGGFRAVIIHGPPGIGKTTAAHLVARLEGYDIVESNASDTRSKKMIEEGLRGVLSTTSLLGYFSSDHQKVESSKKKLCLIMDEVDGMSAGDRGGVGALAAICKKTEIPIILICNDRKLPKMKPFDYVAFDLQFRRPTTDQIRGRIMTIAFRENIKLPPNVINALIEGTGADIRQVVNMLSATKLDQEAMDFDKGKQMSKAWEKHIILKPWDITSKILGGGMFAESSQSTLADKIELYFNDHELSSLMLQENYLGTHPIASLNYTGRRKNLKILEMAEKASESISDGDLVDRMIHGSQQHWTLMPTHAVFSFVRPASFIAGSLAGHQTRFTSWLGKNSAEGKLKRMVKEIQGHMRLRTSGDRHEIRQQYMPVLWDKLVRPLAVQGKETVPDIINLMDSYFLTRDDWDAIVELGVGPMDMDDLPKKKIESQTKATFTRLYNAQSHPMPFMKASSVVPTKKMAKEKPDLEEAIEESDDGEVVDEAPDKDEDDADLSKDKYIKAPKKKKGGAAAGAGAAAGKKRGKKAVNDDEDEDEPPAKKGRAKGKAKK